jgi:ribonuclease HI
VSFEPAVIVHADEACLGNGRDGKSPGGAGGLVEVVSSGPTNRRTNGPTDRRTDGPADGRTVIRRDYWISEPDTTNNRMAIRSAITALELLGARGKRPDILFVSDSEYLIKGVREWMPAWIRRDWKNVKNPELWQQLAELKDEFLIEWRWVRGHADHVRNEYADFLATRAARDQSQSDGLEASGFTAWLAAKQQKGKYIDFS